MSQLTLEPEYQDFLAHIKQHYQKAQLKAVYTVNCLTSIDIAGRRQSRLPVLT